MSDQTRPSTPQGRPADTAGNAFTRFLKATEIDTRLLGMAGALLGIWVGFHLYGVLFRDGGAFLTPRNLWNLSVQTSSIGIMATGMVLIIVTRNIDLSVGSVLGFVAMIMGVLQVNILPQYLGLGSPYIWIITVIVGMTIGALVGTFNGWMIAYRGIPSFIVTLGGLMFFRGAAFLVANGKTISPVDASFALLGGGPYGAIGFWGSWVVGILGCAGVLLMLRSGRANRKKHDFGVRPMWAEVFMAMLGCGLILGATLLVNSYPWPSGIVKNFAAAHNITVPPEGLFISHGYAIPVLILVFVGLSMTFLMTRTRFGRYVFAIGGNPEAAALAGINTKWMLVRIYALMGMLAGLSAVVSSARLNSATNALGLSDELYVIAAAVIGGTSLAGGVGTIYGAILGALVMESLRTGMVLIGFDTSIQSMVVGAVLVLAVYVDNIYRSKTK
jgi:D-xylose transport system permease protein